MKRNCPSCGAPVSKKDTQCPQCSAPIPKKKKSLSGRLILWFGLLFLLAVIAYLVLLFLRVGNPLHLWGTQKALDRYFGMFDLYYTMDSYDPQKVADQIAGNAPEAYWKEVYGSDWEDEILSFVEDKLNGDSSEASPGYVVVASGIPEEDWEEFREDRDQLESVKSMKIKVLSVSLQPKDSILYDEWAEKCDLDVDKIATVCYEMSYTEDGEKETDQATMTMVQYDGKWYIAFAGYEEALR